MTKELGGHGDTDIARKQALKVLGVQIDPFQEGATGEKIRAIGLSNLFVQMADPSLEFIKNTSAQLQAIPEDQLKELGYSIYTASNCPDEFFDKNGIKRDNSEKLSTGIENTGQFIDDIQNLNRYSEETTDLAQVVFDKIQVNNGERQIVLSSSEVHQEPDLKRKYSMALKLRTQILEYVKKWPFTFLRGHSDESLPTTWQTLSEPSRLSVRLNMHGSSLLGGPQLLSAVDTVQGALRRLPFEKKLEELPQKDQERFDELRLQFGAKGANLILLSELVGTINELQRNKFCDLEIAVPDFKVVPVDIYHSWKAGKPIDDELRTYYEWAKELKEEPDWRESDTELQSSDYIVRSSAVFSEDGATVTGAGIYDSVRVSSRKDFEGFIDAVMQVYESTDSPRAMSYRKQNGIEGEDMGLVIQRYVSPRSMGMFHRDQGGYANSRMAGVPGLMEVITQSSRNFINRKELDFFLALKAATNNRAFRGVHHFLPDQYKVQPSLPIEIAQVASIIERIWAKDIQLEFVVADYGIINLVQVRELPETTQGIEVVFPDETPVHTGASIGVGDMDVPVLEEGYDNSKKTGVIVLRGNYGWSMKNNDHYLPKEGAVVIFGSDGENGHIQTLCAEKGLLCVFPDINDHGLDATTGSRFRDLSDLKRMRILSNGFEARVYKGQELANTDEQVIYDRDLNN